jgi:hypothetical protein
MKLTKTAYGKQKLKISRTEWEGIGKQAGWMKKSQGRPWSTEDTQWFDDNAPPAPTDWKESNRQKAMIVDKMSGVVEEATWKNPELAKKWVKDRLNGWMEGDDYTQEVEKDGNLYIYIISHGEDIDFSGVIQPEG